MTYLNARHLISDRRLWLLSEVESRRKSGHDLSCIQGLHLIAASSAAAFLAREGRPVTMIFRATDAFLASPNPLPDYIRKSRCGARISVTISSSTNIPGLCL